MEHSTLHRLLSAVLVAAALLLSSCSQPGAQPAPQAAATSVQPAPTQAPTLPPSDTPAPPSSTPVPPTPTPVPPTDTPAPTPVPPTDTPAPPTETSVPPTDTPEPPTETPAPAAPQAVPRQNINVRGGPGTEYAVAGSARAGQALEITGKNPAGSWWQVCCFDGKKGWVSAALVTTSGDVSGVAVPADMPAPPPTSTPGPTSATPPSVAGGALRGILLYSVANMDAGRWELWQYTFATGEAKFMKEWRTEAAFSRNYSQVAYFSWGPGTGDKPGIYAANADLSGERLIFEGWPAYPSFSPDGGRLAVQGGDEFYVMNADGSGIHPIDIGEYPAWSPVDNWVAHRGCYGGDCGLWLTHADSGERRRLTTGGGDGQPAWSPNGQQIAYISKDDGNFEIYRINRDGSGKVRLTSESHSDGLPVWSPGGDWIAFRSDRGGTWAVYVMRTDGSGVRKITDANVLAAWFFEKMAWRP